MTALLSRSFELVFYDPTKKSRRSTHFSGTPGPVLTTEHRFDYLKAYAKALTAHFGLPQANLAVPVVSEGSCRRAARRLKEKPGPEVRRLIPLKYWRWTLEGDDRASSGGKKTLPGYAGGGTAGRGRKWKLPGYDDRCWNELAAPTLVCRNRPLLLRTEFQGLPAQRTVFDIEGLVGEFDCWVNGKLAGHDDTPAPVNIEISKHVRAGHKNCVALRVAQRCGHQIGLAGEVTIRCTDRVHVEDVFVRTRRIEGRRASVEVQVSVRNEDRSRFIGTCDIEFFEWFPKEKRAPTHAVRAPLDLRSGHAEQVIVNCLLKPVRPWSPESPHLYRVRAVLRNRAGSAIDDLVEVCGIRTVEQKDGRIRLNGKEFFIRSFGDNLGFAPASDFHGSVCPHDDLLIRDMLLCKEAGANTMRLHPWGHTGSPGSYNDHGWPEWGEPCDATNYGRIAHIADQLGICLFWVTRCWTLWNLKDDHRRDRYAALITSSITRVRNHPSIIIYEGLNEVALAATLTSKGPAVFKALRRSYRRFLQAVNSVDSSRLLLPDTPFGPWYARRDGCCDEKTVMAGNVLWTMHCYCGWYADFQELGKQREDLPKTPDPTFLKRKERPLVLAECGAEAMPDWDRCRRLPWHGVWLNNGSPAGRIEAKRLGRPLRILENSEAEISQAYQALCLYMTAAYLRRNRVDGMNVNLIADGLAEGLYHKGVTDLYRYAKLGFFGTKMSYQNILVTGMSGNFVLSNKDALDIALVNDSRKTLRRLRIEVVVLDLAGRTVDTHSFVCDAPHASVCPVGSYKPRFPKKGLYRIEYRVLRK